MEVYYYHAFQEIILKGLAHQNMTIVIGYLMIPKKLWWVYFLLEKKVQLNNLKNKKSNKKDYHVYVIGLKLSFAKTKAAKEQNPDFVPGPNKRCYYVGYSSNTPEVRYNQHITGYINKKGHKIFSKIVYKFGYKRNGLRPRRYKNINPLPSLEAAMKMEVELAEQLRKNGKGHCVYQK